MVGKKDTTMLCKTCEHTQLVVFHECLRSGWPECCGRSMSLESTRANIHNAVGRAIKEQLPR